MDIVDIDLNTLFKDSHFKHVIIEITKPNDIGDMMAIRKAVVGAMADEGYSSTAFSQRPGSIQLGFLTNADAELQHESVMASCRNSFGSSTSELLNLMGQDHADLDEVPLGLFFENLEHLLKHTRSILLNDLVAKIAWFYRVLEVLKTKPQWQVQAREGLVKLDEMIGAGRVESFRNSALYKATKPFSKFDWATLRTGEEAVDINNLPLALVVRTKIAPRSIAEYMERQDQADSTIAAKELVDHGGDWSQSEYASKKMPFSGPVTLVVINENSERVPAEDADEEE